MEAEVLNPKMMADVNGNNKIQNAELEVIKLQELVRKLEKQNEQLRTRANSVNNCNNGPHIFPTSSACLHGSTACSASSPVFSANYSNPALSHPCALGPYTSSEEPFSNFQQSSVFDADVEDVDNGPATVLDEVDILDLDTILPVGESDHSWLYVCPKARLRGECVLSPLQWSRLVLDHPGPEVEVAKRSLCHRLEQAKWRRSISSSGLVSSVRPYSSITEGISPLSFPILPYTKPAALTTESTAPFSASSHPLRQQQTLPGRGSCSLNSAYHIAGVSRQHAAVSPQSSMDSEVGTSELEDGTISMGYKLQDMTDVQVMARLQEESLRQEYATSSTSATASRRSSSFSLRCSKMDLEEEEEDEEGYNHLPPPQPRLLRTGSMQWGSLSHSHTFSSISSIRECSRRSTSTPQYSPSGLSQYQQQFSGPSSLIVDTYGYRSSTVPSAGHLSQRFQSVGNFQTTPRHPVKATAYVSPTVQQGPSSSSNTLSTSVILHNIPSSAPQPLKGTIPSGVPQPSSIPRSALPRPASFIGTGGTPRPSKIAQSTHSLLTPPKSLAALSALRDGSWKDGCY
ncbi:SLAIN motif-containing protein 1a isoform X2 [Coregonus clupeaformis]|uniref:SLAIN motif-containing protein 1a isoform X2 n=1 Tax=Coregonus clupeaformis TaxID=59861 RepID=UPI001E1C4498|nr:SLAIN motif-containing protein 1a isoform X2 [Coregonus clupeaformis]